MEKCNCAHAGASKLPFVECSGVKMFYDRTIKNYSSKACDVYSQDGSFLRTLPRCTAFQTHCNDTEKRCEKIRLEAMKRRMREYDCIERIEEEERRRHTCSQQCPVPCDEYNYDVTYSLSKWPAKGSEADAAYWDIFRVRILYTYNTIINCDYLLGVAPQLTPHQQGGSDFSCHLGFFTSSCIYNSTMLRIENQYYY